MHRTTFTRRGALLATLLVMMVAAMFGNGQIAHAASKQLGTTCAFTITVQQGDWLSRISPQWRRIAAQSGIQHPNRIYPGETLCITASQAAEIRQQRLEALRLVAVHRVEFVTTALHKTVIKKRTNHQHGGNGVTQHPRHKGSHHHGGNGGPPVPVGGNLGPCGGNYNWSAESPSLWRAPVGCFGRIFAQSAVSSAPWHSPGWCNYVVEALRHTNNLWGLGYSHIHVGAVVFFSGGVWGASRAGHWAMVASIHNGWMLIIEENFAYRGGGFYRLDYRFVPISRGETFLG